MAHLEVPDTHTGGEHQGACRYRTSSLRLPLPAVPRRADESNDFPEHGSPPQHLIYQVAPRTVVALLNQGQKQLHGAPSTGQKNSGTACSSMET